MLGCFLMMVGCCFPCCCCCLLVHRNGPPFRNPNASLMTKENMTWMTIGGHSESKNEGAKAKKKSTTPEKLQKRCVPPKKDGILKGKPGLKRKVVFIGGCCLVSSVFWIASSNIVAGGGSRRRAKAFLRCASGSSVGLARWKWKISFDKGSETRSPAR